MSADDRQLRHDVQGALAIRLEAIRARTEEWHEWHQAGVLVTELAKSAHLQQWGQRTVLALIDDATWLFENALERTPDKDSLAIYAIGCDLELALAFGRYVQVRYTSTQQFPDLDMFIDALTRLPLNPTCTHQLAIAHGFMARASWWQYVANHNYSTVCEQAEAHEAHADRLFRENLPESPDGGRAYCSHLLAMALIHAGLQAPQWRRDFVWPALRLAFRQRDYPQVLRAIIIALRGTNGEVWLRSRRDTPAVFGRVSDKIGRLRQELTE